MAGCDHNHISAIEGRIRRGFENQLQGFVPQSNLTDSGRNPRMSVELTDRLRIRSASAIPKTCEKKAVAFETFGRQLIGQQLDPVWPGQVNPIVARLSGGLKFFGLSAFFARWVFLVWASPTAPMRTCRLNAPL